MSKTQQKPKTQTPYFQIKLSKAQDLKTFFGLAEILVKSITVQVFKGELEGDEGLCFRTMDPSHVAMVDVVMASNQFEKWSVYETGFFAVRADEICKVIKNFDKKDSVELSISQKDPEVLRLKTSTSEQSIRLFEADESNANIPRIAFRSMFTIKTKELKTILKRIQLMSEHITMKLWDNGKIEFYGKGDSGDVRISLEKGMSSIPEIHVKEFTEATFSIKYLLEFVKTITSDDVTLDLATKNPIRLESKIDKLFRASYYLTPKVEY